MHDIELIAFVFGILFSELGAVMMPVALATTAVAAAANVQFEPVAV
ncbi:hypothetical protein ACFQY5_20920 [Paeniroseomonas aquatica]|uniref:DedA family protein n=1 Tax=Paeniroseomonas aquatica TaxID=373043 RepID=A0ABT8A4E4_9PROT|nr:hypothetical protein [Paeniroseomonas aquatica]MDN3564662.1 hypothetical protein [Paeniroseomonas aquatica]